MKYKAIIFDLDGVICHTDMFHYQAWQKIADEIGVHFDQQKNHRLRGVSRRDSLEIILESHPGLLKDQEKEYYLAQKNQLYRGMLGQISPADLSEEVKSTMDELRERGLLLAIGSSSHNARFILQRLGLGNYFDAVADGSDISRSKPDPEVFLKASEYLGVAPPLCLVVEDAESGIIAAHRANMDCAAYGVGTTYRLAEYDLEYFSDLLDIVSGKKHRQ